jgi:hypothetical protein
MAGNMMEPEFSSAFTTESAPDTQAPEIFDKRPEAVTALYTAGNCVSQSFSCSFSDDVAVREVTASLDGSTVPASDYSVVMTGNGGTFSCSPCLAIGQHALMVTVRDAAGNQGSHTWSIEVVREGQAPTITSIAVPTGPVLRCASIEVCAEFTDPDGGDAHIVLWEWGDGSTSSGTVDEDAGMVTATHVYSVIGTYIISLTVTDSTGLSDEMEAAEYVVVYDPQGGHVTGGGWFD